MYIFSHLLGIFSCAPPLPPPASSPLSKDRALHVSLTKYQWTLLIHFHEKQYLVTDFAGKL